MRRTTPFIMSAFVLMALSVYSVYALGIDWNSLNLAITLFGLGIFVLFGSLIVRRISTNLRSRSSPD